MRPGEDTGWKNKPESKEKSFDVRNAMLLCLFALIVLTATEKEPVFYVELNFFRKSKNSILISYLPRCFSAGFFI